MNVSMIQMPPDMAQEKLDAYKDALGRRHSAEVEQEWSAALDAYKELAKGTPLIDPLAAIREAGWRPDGRPVLAIGRADQKMVTWDVGRHSRWWNSEAKRSEGRWAPMSWEFTAAKERWNRQRARNLVFTIDQVNTEPPVAPKQGTAMVPMVPPDVLPARGCDLSKHFVLWEVESWDFAPPVDPILLRPIGGNLYAVIAQWDLTEVERMIIAGTRKQQ
jgi:hypothetical protein